MGGWVVNSTCGRFGSSAICDSPPTHPYLLFLCYFFVLFYLLTTYVLHWLLPALRLLPSTTARGLRWRFRPWEGLPGRRRRGGHDLRGPRAEGGLWTSK